MKPGKSGPFPILTRQSNCGEVFLTDGFKMRFLT
jgi:hypothetical protein